VTDVYRGLREQILTLDPATVGRARTAEELGYGLSELSPVCYAAQEVITQLRLIDEQRANG
jgi:hypothetical protein